MKQKSRLVAALLIAASLLGSGRHVLAASDILVISYDHRRNIKNAQKLDIDALSAATVYTGATGEKKSTVQVIRDTILQKLDASVFEIEVKKPYSKNYQKTVARADKEIEANTRLKLKKQKIKGLKKVSQVYLVTPIWHGTLPQPVKVLLKANDFSGKTLTIFGANLGSGFGQIPAAVKKCCPKATIVTARTWQGDASNASVRKKVKKWLKSHPAATGK